MLEQFEEGKFVIVAGEGDEAFVIRRIDEANKRLALSNGVWEPMDKCRVVKHDDVVRRITYHYTGV